MAYDKKTWASHEIVNKDELDHIEQGIDDAHTLLDSIQTQIDAIPDISGLMQIATYDPDEDGKVDNANVADALSSTSGNKTYDNVITTVNELISTHTNVTDAHHARYTDAEAQGAINSDTDHGSTAQHNYRTDEEIQDVCASLIAAGENVSVTYDDSSNTLTISSTGLSPTDRTKFDGIEEGATADMTGDEIITAINASTLVIDADNVNVTGGSGLTEEQLIKLNGIEDGATADQTAEEMIELINASSSKINATNLTLNDIAVPIERGFIGEVVVGDCLRIYIARDCTLLSATTISGTQPSGETLNIDIRKNGYASTNSIFSSDTPMMLSTSATLTDGGVYTVNGILDETQTSLTARTVLRAYVLQTGGATDVSVCLEVLY